MQKTVYIDPSLLRLAPSYKIIYLEADVTNSDTTTSLINEMKEAESLIIRDYELASIKTREGIKSTREIYKKLGKDPNRYRPSQEQLMRRVIRGLGLYNVNSLVDAGNLFSLKTGYSIGIFDRDSIAGEQIKVGVGREEEPYIGIGRGELNVEGLPILRDEIGGFGTPTSDNERTKTSLKTKRISATVHVFDSEKEDLESLSDILEQLLKRNCYAQNIEIQIV